MSTNNFPVPQKAGAAISECGQYRYGLWRIWDASRPYCLFVMLNPSTADETDNDPTVERCLRRARDMGYGGLHIVNLFAWRSTDPSILTGLDDPVGPDNDKEIVALAQDAGIVICAWGKDGAILGRANVVLAMLRQAGIQPHGLKFNLDGSPKHPLYVAYAEQPKPF